MSKKNPWLKFYPRDWRGDQALRAVSIAARGLWIECLCIMHEAKPYGHLVLNGNPVEGDTLARMTGVPVDEVAALMAELRQAGVLSVTGEGIVFSRRMTKDHARAQKGRLSAKRRWRQASDGVEQSEAPNRYPIGSPNTEPITQKPEGRSQKKKNDPSDRQKKASRGSRLPENWEPPPNALPGVQLDAEFLASEVAKFRDYWRAKPGQGGVKLDWDATWRNWLRIAIERRPPEKSGPTVRKNCEGWIIPHGTPEYEAWAAHYRRENSPRMYDFPDKAGTEARAPSRWPARSGP